MSYVVVLADETRWIERYIDSNDALVTSAGTEAVYGALLPGADVPDEDTVWTEIEWAYYPSRRQRVGYRSKVRFEIGGDFPMPAAGHYRFWAQVDGDSFPAGALSIASSAENIRTLQDHLSDTSNAHDASAIGGIEELIEALMPPGGGTGGPIGIEDVTGLSEAIAAAGNIAAVIHTNFPVSAFGGTIGGGEATIPAFASGVPVGGYIWVEDQTDEDDDGFYQHDGGGVFVQLVPGFVSFAYAGKLIVTIVGIGPDPGVWGIHLNGATPFIQRESMTVAEVQELIDAGDFASASSVVAIEARLPALVDAYEGEDDTEMIEAAIAANPGGCLLFQPRVYTVRRPISLPDNTELAGTRQALTVLQKIAGLEMAILSGATDNSTEIVVDDATGLSVGDALTVSSNVHHEWDSSPVVVTAIDGDTITFAPDLEMDYSGEDGLRAVRSFPVIQNVGANTPDGTHDSVTGLWVHDLTVDQNFDADLDINDSSGRLDFTCSAIHWDKVRNSLVERVTVLNAVSDAYSDQARADTMADQGVGNTIRGCTIESPARHGIHLGTYMWDAKVLDNTVVDAGHPDRLDDAASNTGSGLFYCAEVVGTIARGNRFVNCWGGFYGGDVNPGRISGDVFNLIIGNQITGQIAGSTMRAIEPGGKAIVSNNVIREWGGKGIVLAQNCDRSIIEGNHVEMIGFEAAFQATNVNQFDLSDNMFSGAGNGMGVSLDGCSDVTITGGRIAGFQYGVTMVDCHRVMCSAPTPSATAGYRFISDPSSDIRIDLTTTDPVVTTSNIDESTLDLVTRLVVNGLGDNGTDDPSAAGPWFDVTDHATVLHQRRWPLHNTLVHWVDVDEHRLSRYLKLPGDVAGVWISSSSGGGVTEEYVEGVMSYLSEALLASMAGRVLADEWIDPATDPGGVAFRSYNVAGWAKIRVEFLGLSTRASNTDSLLLTVNADTTDIYHTAAAAAAASLTLGGVPGSQTNTDRHGMVNSDLSILEGVRKPGISGATQIISTTTGGAAAGAPGGLSITSTAEVTTVQVKMNVGNIAAGSNIRIIGLVPTPS